MQPPTITCRKCHGKGKVTLSPTLAEFYACLLKLGKARVGDIKKELNWDRHITLYSHCASRLERLKLIKKVDPNERWPVYEVV